MVMLWTVESLPFLGHALRAKTREKKDRKGNKQKRVENEQEKNPRGGARLCAGPNPRLAAACSTPPACLHLDQTWRCLHSQLCRGVTSELYARQDHLAS